MFREEKIINEILHYRTSPDADFKPYTLEKLTNQVEMLKQQQGYSEEEVEKLIKTTYEETMRAMVDWFINNKDKSKEEMESAIENYVYPKLAEKGIKFKNK